MKLVVKATGLEVKAGDLITSLQGEAFVIVAARPPRTAHSSGHVIVKPKDGGQTREYYPSVFGLQFVEKLVGEK